MTHLLHSVKYKEHVQKLKKQEESILDKIWRKEREKSMLFKYETKTTVQAVFFVTFKAEREEKVAVDREHVFHPVSFWH